jgi:hypothetical protein
MSSNEQLLIFLACSAPPTFLPNHYHTWFPGPSIFLIAECTECIENDKFFKYDC